MPTSELVPGFEAKILEEAIQSPAVAMMRLSLEVDRQLRLILAVIGQLKDYTGQSPSEALDLIGKSIEGSAIPVELRDTLKSFWNLRNMVVHGGNAQQGFAMRALDYGFRILRMLQAIPRPSYVVRSSVQKCAA
jgi:ribosomal protein S6E (S10)